MATAAPLNPNPNPMDQTGHSDTTTDGIRIRVAAQYLPDRSDPEVGRWIYAYRVIITNDSVTRAKLVSRHWIITDADNGVEEVKGPGVVGEHPDLDHGESFRYMSGCPLPTSWGTMEGSYTFKREDGSTFDAHIGRFFLAPNVAPMTTL